MNRLKWWFRIVGIFYILLGIGFIPALNSMRLNKMLPNFDAPIGGVAYHGLLDFSFMFGLDLLITGAFLLHFSGNPLKYSWFVWFIVALEIVRGIIDDLYMIISGYEAPFFIIFIIVHLIIIVTGILFLKKERI